MSNNRVRILIVFCFLLLGYAVSFQLIPFVKNGAYWINYSLGLFAIVICGMGVHIGMRGKDIQSKFYGFPIVKVAFIYLLLQLLCSVLFMSLSIVVPAWVGGIIGFLLMTATLIGYVGLETVKEEVERQEFVITADTSNMRTLQIKMRAIQAETRIASVAKLIEEIRYSDPVSCTDSIEKEKVLLELSGMLSSLLKNTNEEEVNSICNEMLSILVERNEICRRNK